MKPILFACVTFFFVIGTAAAYKPAEERELRDIAATGCVDRNDEYIVHGLVSSATVDTVVLSDTADERTTMAVTLPGRGVFARAKGVFGRSKYETAEEVLNHLREEGTPVEVTLKCHGKGTPSAVSISYGVTGGERESITF